MVGPQKNTFGEKIDNGGSSHCSPYKEKPVWDHSQEPGDSHSWVAHSSPGTQWVLATWDAWSSILLFSSHGRLWGAGTRTALSAEDADTACRATVCLYTSPWPPHYGNGSHLAKLGHLVTSFAMYFWPFVFLVPDVEELNVLLLLSLLWIACYHSCSEELDEAVCTGCVHVSALCVCLYHLCVWPCVNMHIAYCILHVVYTCSVCVCWEHTLSLISSWTLGHGAAAASPLLGCWIHYDSANWWFLMKSDGFCIHSSVKFCMSKSIFHEQQ